LLANAIDHLSNAINILQAVCSKSKTASNTKKTKDAPVAQLDRATDDPSVALGERYN